MNMKKKSFIFISGLCKMCSNSTRTLQLYEVFVEENPATCTGEPTVNTPSLIVLQDGSDDDVYLPESHIMSHAMLQRR